MTQVFISYSRTDKEFVQRLAADLERAGIDVWWDLTDIQGSDVWERKIDEGLRTSQYFIVVLTPASLESRWVRREYLSADNSGVRIIPLKLKPYEKVPLTLRDIQPIDAIDQRYENVLSDVFMVLKGSDGLGGKIVTPIKNVGDHIDDTVNSKDASKIDILGTIALISYFILSGFNLLASSSTMLEILIAVSALLGGIFLWIRRQIPSSVAFKLSVIIYLCSYSLNRYYFYDDSLIVLMLAGISALISAGILAMTLRIPKKFAPYSSISFALFLILITVSILLGQFEIYPDAILGLIISVITSILLLMDL